MLILFLVVEKNARHRTARLVLAAYDALAGRMGNGEDDMEDAMNIIMLYQNDSIERLVTEVRGWENYTVTSTPDPAEALRVIEESAEPCLILTDNLKVNPVAREALASLRANPELRERVRVIGLDIALVRQIELDWGILDDFIAMPLTVDTLLDSIEANASQLGVQ